MKTQLSKFTLTATFGLALALAFSCSLQDDDNKGNNIANYRTVRIGNQTWMAENLNYKVNGSVCYDKDPVNCNKYGRLYDWKTAKTVCPAGWHLPSNADWNKLVSYVESNNGCNSCAGRYLKATSGWSNGGNGQDAYGFSALPGGFGSSDSSFSTVGYYGYWWSSSELSGDYAYSRRMGFSFDGVNNDNDSKSSLQSVLCVRD